MTAESSEPQPSSRGKGEDFLTTVHDSRTLMLKDLVTLVDALAGEMVTPDRAREAVVTDNVLGKKTHRTRQKSFQYLQRLYSLDEHQAPGQLFFRLFRVHQAAQGQLAALQVLSVDRLFQATLATLLSCEENQPVEAAMFVAPVRGTGAEYRDITLESCTRNLISSWSQAGWLTARLKKRRLRVDPLPESVAFALYLGYQEGRRGLRLMNSRYMEAFSSSPETLDELAYQASRLGYLSYRRIADVLEIHFPHLGQRATESHE